MALAMGRNIEPTISGERRAGDIRHCLADISLAQSVLDFSPGENFSRGLAELAEWVAQQSCENRVETARDELAARGLVA
jgi:dTDP-L-rhamnose 4-epimerase